jgi:hypothetical protein
VFLFLSPSSTTRNPRTAVLHSGTYENSPPFHLGSAPRGFCVMGGKRGKASQRKISPRQGTNRIARRAGVPRHARFLRGRVANGGKASQRKISPRQGTNENSPTFSTAGKRAIMKIVPNSGRLRKRGISIPPSALQMRSACRTPITAFCYIACFHQRNDLEITWTGIAVSAFPLHVPVLAN